MCPVQAGARHPRPAPRPAPCPTLLRIAPPWQRGRTDWRSPALLGLPDSRRCSSTQSFKSSSSGGLRIMVCVGLFPTFLQTTGSFLFHPTIKALWGRCVMYVQKAESQNKLEGPLRSTPLFLGGVGVARTPGSREREAHSICPQPPSPRIFYCERALLLRPRRHVLPPDGEASLGLRMTCLQSASLAVRIWW